MNAAVTVVNTELLEGQARVLELIARGAPLVRVLDSLLRLIQSQCPGMLCSVLIMEPDGMHVRHCSAPDLPEGYTRSIDGAAIGPKAGSCGTAAWRREMVIVEDILTDPLWNDYRQLALPYDLRACWSTPIFDAESRLLGTFAMYFRTPGRPESDHLRLIEISTHIASIAISQHQAAEETTRRQAQLVEAQHIAKVGSYEWDLRTNRVRRSEELDRIFGLQHDEFEPSYEGYISRVHPEDRETTKSIIDASLRDGKPFDMEERIIRPDGTVRVLHSQGHWTFDELHRPLTLVGICQDITERKQVERQLETLSARLMRAQEEERARLARELHDDLSQEVAALSIATSKLKKGIPAGNAAVLEQSDRIQQNLIRLAEKVRRLSHNLHPAMLEFSGLGVAIQRYCAEFSQLTGVRVIFDSGGSFAGVPNSVALSVYRVAQEALQNVLKHAHVDQAQLGLYMDEQTLTLTVSDAGTGIDPLGPASPGLGIVSIKERARMMGGNVTIESSPNCGTKLMLTVPMSHLVRCDI